MNFLSPFITRSRFLSNAALQSQKRVFEVLSNLLSDSEDALSSDFIYQKLYERERIGSTAVGRGVVVPHCRIENLSITKMAVLTLSEPMAYENAEEGVDIFIAVIFPLHIQNIHHQFMTALVSFLKTDGMLTKIRAAESNEALYDIFAEKTVI
ncbi:MAG: PTS sugar transporter subunit IIA [Francisellaceae bacterium]